MFSENWGQFWKIFEENSPGLSYLQFYDFGL